VIGMMTSRAMMHARPRLPARRERDGLPGTLAAWGRHTEVEPSALDVAPVPAIGHAFGDLAIVPEPRTDVAEAELSEPTVTTAAARSLVQRAPDPDAPGTGAPPPTAGPDAPPGDPLQGGKAASGSTTITVSSSTRTVSAATLSDLWDVLTRSGTREAASVQPKLTPPPQYEYSGDDRVTKATVTVVEQKEMPVWKEADAQCPPIKNEWNRVLGVLDTHENKHVAIDKTHYADAHLKLVGKKREDAWAAMEAVVAAADAANHAYDTQTQNGAAEGAKLNTAVQCAPEKVKSNADTGEDKGIFSTIGEFVGGLMPKLTVGAVDDPLEREADAVAERVMRDESPSVRRAAAPSVQRCTGSGQCECDRCKEEEERRATAADGTVRRHAEGDGASAGGAFSDAALGRVDAAVRGGGRPLGDDSRADMETRFGHDFSRVRIHDDASAAESAAMVQARAYTLGADIVFARGEYAPGTTEGRRLLAHELTHVVQQGMSAPVVRRQPARIQRQGKEDGPPASRTGPNASTTSSPAPDSLKADFERAVSDKDWGKAATLLNGFNDAELPKKAEWLTTEDRESIRHATPEALHRVRGALLVATFKAAVQAGEWGKAAENLNGLDDPGIESNTRTLDTHGRANLYVGALNAMTGGSRDRITGPIARIDLDAAYQAVLRPPPDWPKAAEYLNGFNDDDIRARTEKLSATERAAMRPFVPEWMHRVRGGLLDAGFKQSLTAGDFDAAARDLNGFDDPGIVQRVQQQVPADQLEALLTGSDRANGGASLRIDRHIYPRLLGGVMTPHHFFVIARSLQVSLEKGIAVADVLATFNPGQLQGLLSAAQQSRLPAAAQAIAPVLSQARTDQQSSTLAYNLDPNQPPDQINLTQSRERQSPTYIDNVAYQVMVGIYLPGYFVYCIGQDLPIVIPWEYVNYSTNPVPAINEIVYNDRSSALAEIAATANAPRGSYAYFRGGGGFSAPTMFSFATAPHIVGMLQDAVTRLKDEVQHELTIQALFLAGAVVANFTAAAFSRSGGAKSDAKEPSKPTPPTAGKPGSVGAMRLPKYEVGPVEGAGPGLKPPSPAAGQEAVENSLPVGSELGPTRRVGISRETGEIVDFTETGNETFTFRGVVRQWDQLPAGAQNELIGAGYVTRGGRVVRDVEMVSRTARMNNFRRIVSPAEIRGAPPAEGSNVPGHAAPKHKATPEQQAAVVNSPERVFNGVNESPREVDIYCKRIALDSTKPGELTDMVVITEAGDKTSVITMYPRSASHWEANASYVEIKVGSSEIVYSTPADWQLDFWPEWNWRTHSSQGIPPRSQ
jgi:predicted secreted Zn-dependent protease